MEIKIDPRDELDARLREKISKHECIHEPELLNRITDLLIERDILIDDIQSYHDKLKDISETNKSKMKDFEDYIEERKQTKLRVPEFKEGYVVVDATDNHVLDNKIFDVREDAENFRRECLESLPSLIENNYVIMKCGSNCLEYGAFPYEKTLYFIYDLEK